MAGFEHRSQLGQLPSSANLYARSMLMGIPSSPGLGLQTKLVRDPRHIEHSMSVYHRSDVTAREYSWRYNQFATLWPYFHSRALARTYLVRDKDSLRAKYTYAYRSRVAILGHTRLQDNHVSRRWDMGPLKRYGHKYWSRLVRMSCAAFASCDNEESLETLSFPCVVC